MGWIGVTPTPGMKPADYVLRDLLPERVVDHSVRTELADNGRTTRYVVFVAYSTPMVGTMAVVGFVEQRDGYVWTKIMDETVGPCHDKPCPKKIMRLLSPCNPGGYSAGWRVRQGS